MRPNWPYFSCLDEGEGEGEVKHENEAISAALFTQRMGEGLNRNTNMRNAAKLATFFMFGWGRWGRKGRTQGQARKMRPFRPHFSCSEWQRVCIWVRVWECAFALNFGGCRGTMVIAKKELRELRTSNLTRFWSPTYTWLIHVVTRCVIYRRAFRFALYGKAPSVRYDVTDSH